MKNTEKIVEKYTTHCKECCEIITIKERCVKKLGVQNTLHKVIRVIVPCYCCGTKNSIDIPQKIRTIGDAYEK